VGGRGAGTNSRNGSGPPVEGVEPHTPIEYLSGTRACRSERCSYGRTRTEPRQGTHNRPDEPTRDAAHLSPSKPRSQPTRTALPVALVRPRRTGDDASQPGRHTLRGAP
jgi:hypothetical protein